MRKLILIITVAFTAYLLTFAAGKIINKSEDTISFYKVPLVCDAAPEIGCGSRVKPLFIEIEKNSVIKEAWLIRQGTVIAIVWDPAAASSEKYSELAMSLFKKHSIDAVPVTDEIEKRQMYASLKGEGIWYKGMDVDKLSIEEAGVIAGDVVKLAEENSLLNNQEASVVKADIESYFKEELVKVRTLDELGSRETQDTWKKDVYNLFVKHIGKDRSDKVAELYEEKGHSCDEQKPGSSCCSKKK
ncbi:MAG: hypothetical protein ACRDFC_06050 [Ignavibacteria bacterium]